MSGIVITGASGQYGRSLTDRQVARGLAARLMLITRSPDKLAHRAAQGWGREAMVWRDDCVACAEAVLTGAGHEGQTYNITGPELQTFAEVAAILSEVTGAPIAYSDASDEEQYAMFDAMGIPRRPIDDQAVGGIFWNSDDMVTFGQAIREGFLEVCSTDVEKLTGRPARSVRQMIEDNAAMLKAAANP